MSALRLEKPERKIIEKNRRNQMKLLYSGLSSLIPPHGIGTSKGGDQAANLVNRTIDYIQTLKTNLEVNKNKKDRLLLLLLLSKKRSHEDTKMINNVCIPLDIQIHEMTHDHDAVLVTGLKTYSSFSNVVQFLDQYSTEVTLANFSNSGHSTFHICQKKIDADDICKRLKDSVENMKELGDNTHASFCNEVDLDLSVWDFDLLY